MSTHRLLFRFLQVLYRLAVATPKSLLREARFVRAALRAIRDFDLVIINGGGQLAEPLGVPRAFRRAPWKFAYAIFRWVLLGRIAGVKTVVMNLGIRPPASLLNRVLVRSALSLSAAVYYRDPKSQQAARFLGSNGSAYPDTAYSRDLPVLARRFARGSRKLVVGLAPMVCGEKDPSPQDHDTLDSRLIQQFGRFASWLIDQGHSVTLFCTDIGVDSPFLCGLERVLRESVPPGKLDGCLRRVHQWSTEDLLANMSAMDCVVTSRFHGIVFAHLLNLPFIAVSDHDTVRGLAEELDLSRCYLNLGSCNSDTLAERFSWVVENTSQIKGRMARKLTEYRDQISTQFDELVPPEVPSRLAKAAALAGLFLLVLAPLLLDAISGGSVAADLLVRLPELL